MLYHVNSTGPSKKGFLAGLAKALKSAMKNGSNEVALAVHSKQNLDGIIEDALGEAAIKVLGKSGKLRFENVTIYLVTERISSGFRKGVILACHPSEEYLSKLLKDYRATDVVYVPWAPDEFEKYKNEYDSEEVVVA
ncbi:hypothetical protein MLD55_05035 [Alcanivorax sp. MM125-6]|nr:hypothetical protein [Alcanivorax sp. MM125-6]